MTKKETGPAEPTMFERLLEPFPHDVVEWRAQTISRAGDKALALAYIDARSVMARLDEVVGPQNWQDSYRSEGSRTIGRLSIRMPDTGEWISKEDGSGDSNFEAEKGGISGALKRVAVKWGVGRYLYDVDALWAGCRPRMQNGEMAKDNKGKPIFEDWTEAGQRQLDEALRRAPGPRMTGRPFTVDKMLELIRSTADLDGLAKIWTAHWATIPLAYRKEVLEAKEVRKSDLNRPVDDKPKEEE